MPKGEVLDLSVVVPAYNEAGSLPGFIPDLIKQLDRCNLQAYEIIIVNDGSNDDTLKVAKKFCKESKHIRLVNLSRNFGKEVALSAGITYATGLAVMMIDADGQHPPELIGKFVDSWRQGNQVVIGVRQANQKEGFIKRYGSKLFYSLFNSTTDFNLIPGATDFRLIDKAVRDEFLKFTEHYRITRGLIDWMGFQRAEIPFKAKERMSGKASYSVSNLIKLALNSFVSLSMAPLYVIGLVGALITAVSFVLGLFIFIEQILLNDPMHLKFTGTAMLAIMTIFFVGIVLLAQGLIAVYMSHIHVQTQNRPLFIVDKKNSVNVV